MALQSIWWRDISKDPLFEPLQAKFQPEKSHSSRLVVIWSEIGAQKSALPSRQHAVPQVDRCNDKITNWLPHPSYSPDLAPCNFFLFPNLKTWLGGKKFSSNEEVIVAVNILQTLSLLQMTTKRELCVLSGWNLTWRGSKS